MNAAVRNGEYFIRSYVRVQMSLSLSFLGVLFISFFHLLSAAWGRGRYACRDRIRMVDVVRWKLARNPRELVKYWNMMAAQWLKLHVHERLMKVTIGKRPLGLRLTRLITFTISAFWHGFYPGYYFFFIGCVYFIEVGNCTPLFAIVFSQFYALCRLPTWTSFSLDSQYSVRSFVPWSSMRTEV
jgi:hypothetical protein